MARAPGESRIPVFRTSPCPGTLKSPLARPTTMILGPSTSPGPPSPVNPGVISAIDVGQRVSVGGEVSGVLRFYGPTHLEPLGSIWCGVELDTPHGLNDGCVRGVRYFRCRPNYGILAPEHKVRLEVLPSRVLTASSKKSLSHSNIKRRVPPDRSSPREASRSRRDKQTDSGSGSSQDEITPPVEEQPSSNSQPEVIRQPRSATATPTPGSSNLAWDWSKKNSPVEGEITATAAEFDSTFVKEKKDPDKTKETNVTSPAGSEGRRRISGGLALALPPGSPPACQQPALGSKQSSFELDDSLGILTPDQMLVTDFTVTSAGAGSDDDERPGSAELGGLMLEDPPILEDTVLPASTPPSQQFSTSILAETDDHSEQFSDFSSTADTASKGAACSSSQHQSTSSSIVQQSCGSSNTAPVPACSFITSVTSITSLDNGYQGDGEWSRPASRADNSPTIPPPPPPPGVLAVDVHKLKFDVMTDSDFFSDPGAAGTESDAEHEAAGMAIGDRRARVIDGTLYGTSPASSMAGPLPAAPAHLMTSSAATIEEMDSSGIFSDMERRADISEPIIVQASKKPSDKTDSVPPVASASDQGDENKESDVLHSTLTVDDSNVSVAPTDTPKSAAVQSPACKEEKTSKKHKMPKRNVGSKIKALIESSPVTTKSVENQENRRPARKGGKWDAVMNKIAQNQAEEKSKPKIKEVKSRVFASIGSASPQGSNKTVHRGTSTPTRVNTPRPSSARTRRENSVASKSMPRRGRLRGADSSASLQRVTGGEDEEEEDGPSPNSSHCSSISDVSQEPSLPPSKPSPPRSTKKRAATLDGVSTAHLVRSGSPLSDVSTNSAATQPPSSRTPAHNNNNNGLQHSRSLTTGERGNKTPNSGVASVQQRNQRNALLSATPPNNNRRGATPVATHKSTSEKTPAVAAVTAAAPEMKTPTSLRKATPRITQKPTPLRGK